MQESETPPNQSFVLGIRPAFIAGGSHGYQELANRGIVRRPICWRPRDRYRMQGYDAAVWDVPGDPIPAKAAATRTLSDLDGPRCRNVARALRERISLAKRVGHPGG